MNFPEEVLEEVTVPLSEELTEFLFLLLLREETESHFSAFHSTHTPKERVDVYAYSLNEFFKNLPKIYESGFKVQSDTLLNPYEPEFPHNTYSQFWSDLKTFRVPIRFPHSLRKEHTYILGNTGSGKTQLIQQMISYDLDSNASIIVIDSQGDLIHKLKHTKLIEPERLVIVDPIDSVEYPLALNMFDVGQARLSKLNPVDYERHINGVVELLNFVFSAVMDSALTDKQSIVFNFCIRLMLSVPNATLETFVDVLENGVERYQAQINQLPSLAQNFFRSAFPTDTRARNEYKETRLQILRRLYSLLENPTISRLFKSSKNKLDISKEMDSGKVILISTDRSLLKTQGCAFFGRYFLSLIAQGMQDRLNKPEHHRRKCYVYVDECGDYLNTADVNITDILEKGRKYNVGMTLAHQQIQQLPQEVFQSIKTNSAIKMVGTCSHADSMALRHDLKVDAIEMARLQFLMHSRGARFSYPIPVNVGIIENSEKRTDEEMSAVMESNRVKYCVDFEIPPQSPEIIEKEVKNDKPKDIPDDPLAPYT